MYPISPMSSPQRPSFSRASNLNKSLPPPPLDSPAISPLSDADLRGCTSNMTTVLVGPKQHSFVVNRLLLCEASPFFSKRLENQDGPHPLCLWLPSESADMFSLFVEWVNAPSTFRQFLEQTVSAVDDDDEQRPSTLDVHWAIIRLHLFAAHLDLPRLQDMAMDTIQDLYLRRDWDVPPSLIVYLYTQCEAVASVRLRRWAAAMVAFSLTSAASDQRVKFHPQDAATSDSARFLSLLDSLPGFAADYAKHLRNMCEAGLDVRFKNPQLRIPANKLRNDERLFGFRECSFHTHRSAVGQSRCPEVTGRSRSRHEPDACGSYSPSSLFSPSPSPSPSPEYEASVTAPSFRSGPSPSSPRRCHVVRHVRLSSSLKISSTSHDLA